MNTKTMEGIVGAKTNMNMVNTPMRAYREAERRGDTGAMERAMGYAGDYTQKAESYRQEAEEGMKEDAKEAREKEKAEREKAIQKRKEQREEAEKRIEELQNRTDTVEISEEGKALLKAHTEENATVETETSIRTGTSTSPEVSTEGTVKGAEVHTGD